MSDPRLKQIKIKTGVLKRVGKEKLSYRKEADQQKAKIEKMKEDGKDEVGKFFGTFETKVIYFLIKRLR